MKLLLEYHLPYAVLALTVLVLFYGIYFAKMLAQKQRGIQTRQICLGKGCGFIVKRADTQIN